VISLAIVAAAWALPAEYHAARRVRLAPDPLHRRRVPVGGLLFGCEVVSA